jgi:hypothetical protein
MRYEAGRISVQDWAQSRYHRIRAEILFERAKSGRSIDSAQALGDLP